MLEVFNNGNLFKSEAQVKVEKAVVEAYTLLQAQLPEDSIDDLPGQKFSYFPNGWSLGFPRLPGCLIRVDKFDKAELAKTSETFKEKIKSSKESKEKVYSEKHILSPVTWNVEELIELSCTAFTHLENNTISHGIIGPAIQHKRQILKADFEGWTVEQLLNGKPLKFILALERVTPKDPQAADPSEESLGHFPQSVYQVGERGAARMHAFACFA